MMRRGKGRIDTPIDELDDKDTIEHYNALREEDMESNFKFVLEKMSSIEARMERQFGELKSHMDDQIGLLRKEMNYRFSVVDEALQGLSIRVSRVEERLDRVEARLDKVEARLDKVEARLDKVEARLDSIEAKFDNYGNRISVLEKNYLC